MKQYELPAASVRLVKEAALLSDTPINTPVLASRLVGEWLAEMDREVLCVINVNSKLVPINYSVVSIGSLDEIYVASREIFKASILSNAYGVILLHNHPSRNVTPSRYDFEITNKLIKAGELLDIQVYDHIIVADNRYYSMREESVFPAAMSDEKLDISKFPGFCGNKIETDEMSSIVVNLLKKKGFHISAAESCTAGSFIATIADVPGASSVLDRSFVTYSESAKQELVGVSQKTLSDYGVVSREVAAEMALGVAKATGAEVGIGITGYAGPGGGTKEAPVGTVCVGIAVNGKVNTYVFLEETVCGRNAVRKKVVENILDILIFLLQ